VVEIVRVSELERGAEDVRDTVERKGEGAEEGGEDQAAVVCAVVDVGDRLAFRVVGSVDV
jgi:hypothetical protein